MLAICATTALWFGEVVEGPRLGPGLTLQTSCEADRMRKQIDVAARNAFTFTG